MKRAALEVEAGIAALDPLQELDPGRVPGIEQEGHAVETGTVRETEREGERETEAEHGEISHLQPGDMTGIGGGVGHARIPLLLVLEPQLEPAAWVTLVHGPGHHVITTEVATATDLLLEDSPSLIHVLDQMREHGRKKSPCQVQELPHKIVTMEMWT